MALVSHAMKFKAEQSNIPQGHFAKCGLISHTHTGQKGNDSCFNCHSMMLRLQNSRRKDNIHHAQSGVQDTERYILRQTGACRMTDCNPSCGVRPHLQF